MADARRVRTSQRRCGKKRQARNNSKPSKYQRKQSAANIDDGDEMKFELQCEAAASASSSACSIAHGRHEQIARDSLTIAIAANGNVLIAEKPRYEEDARMIFLCNYVTKSMKIKHEKWTKMLQTDEYNRIVVDYLEENFPESLFITLGHHGALMADTCLAKILALPTTKTCYFIKQAPGAIRSACELHIHGDLSDMLLNTLVILNEEMYFPLIKTQIEHKQWPPVIQSNIDKQLNEFNSALYQMKGTLMGIALLPMPHEAHTIKESIERVRNGEELESDVALKALVEIYISKWCVIIAHVLKESQASLFDNGRQPGPLQELQFWTKKLHNLRNLHTQLKMQDAQEVLAFAEQCGSSYLDGFQKTFKHMIGGIVEAREIVRYMEGLREQFGKLEETNVGEAAEHVGPLLHCIGVLWCECKHYQRNERVGTLFREVANSLIQATVRTLNPHSLFMGDAEETMLKIAQAIDTLRLFVKMYEFVKLNVARRDDNVTVWVYPTDALFERLYRFRARLELIESLLSTHVVFHKLEKIVLGGTKGKALTAHILQIYDTFVTHFLVFQNLEYDVFDLEDERIYADYNAFAAISSDCDNRLAAIFVRAFDECKNLEACCKFVQMLGAFARRDAIAAQLQPHNNKMIAMLEDEIQVIENMYERDCIGTLVPAQIYVKLDIIRQVRRRVMNELNNFKEVMQEIPDEEKAIEIARCAEDLINMLILDEASFLENIFDQIIEEVNQSMQNNLFTRTGGELIVNLNKLPDTIRQVKLIITLGYMDTMPAVAISIHQRHEELVQTIRLLKETAICYNCLLKMLNDEENLIIQDELRIIDEVLEQGITCLTWEQNSKSVLLQWTTIISSYILDLRYSTQVYEFVKMLYDRLKIVKNNVTLIYKSLQCILGKSMFNRSNPDSSEIIPLINRDDIINLRFNALQNLGKELIIVLKFNFCLLNNIKQPAIQLSDSIEHQLSGGKSKLLVPLINNYQNNQNFYDNLYETRAPSMEPWDAYLKNVQAIITKLLLDATILNLSFFVYEMDMRNNVNPLFCIIIELQGAKIMGLPPLDEAYANNFIECMQNILSEIYEMTGKFPSVTLAEHGDYDTHIKSNAEVKRLEKVILTKAILAVDECYEYLTQFEKYHCLLCANREDYLNHFLCNATIITLENWPEISEGNKSGDAEKCTPKLEMFKEQILYFETLGDEVEQIDDKYTISGWLVVDIKPFKYALINILQKWANLFKRHLHATVIDDIAELERFISDALHLIARPVINADLGALLKVMGCLSKIKERQAATDAMFAPLRAIIAFLADYDDDAKDNDISVPEVTIVQLQALPAKWDACKRHAGVARQIIAPLQASQVSAIRKQLALFELQQGVYRDGFRRLPIFDYDCADAYKILNRCHRELRELEITAASLSEQGALFELQIPEFKHVAGTRRELKLLKAIWDYVGMCNSWIDEWRYTPWKRIDVEAMDMDCKKFGKDLRAMDKELRTWNVYVQMEANIKNMLTSLRAVTELQNPSIRERHWNQLMKIIKTPGLNQSYYTVS